MRMTGFTAPRRMMLAVVLSMCICSNALAQMAGVLPVPPECSSSKSFTLPRGNHPKNFKAYGKVDLYCGGSTKAFATGATFCNSDYPESKADTKTVTIAVSTKTKSGKVVPCKAGTDLKFVPE